MSRLRGRHLLALDVLGVLAAAYVALALRYEDVIDAYQFAHWLPIILILITVRVAWNVRFGLYSRGWRFASVPDLERIAAAALAGSVTAFAIVYGASAVLKVDWASDFPRSFWPVEMLIAGAVLGGMRFAIRAASDWSPSAARAADRRPQGDAVLRRGTIRAC